MRVINLAERRRRRARVDRYVIELTATPALHEKLMLAKLLLSDEGGEASLADVVEVALDIWLGDFGGLPRR